MQVKKIRHGESLLKWIKNSRQSELVVVLGEDIAALLGLLFALVSVILAIVTGNPVFDAIGSIGIGVLLVIISFFLAIKIKSLLIGQSADDRTTTDIKLFLEARPEIKRVLNVITIQLGAEIMVSVKAEMAETESVSRLIDHINTCERELKCKFPAVQWAFFEPDVR